MNTFGNKPIFVAIFYDAELQSLKHFLFLQDITAQHHKTIIF